MFREARNGCWLYHEITEPLGSTFTVLMYISMCSTLFFWRMCSKITTQRVLYLHVPTLVCNDEHEECQGKCQPNVLSHSSIFHELLSAVCASYSIHTIPCLLMKSRRWVCTILIKWAPSLLATFSNCLWQSDSQYRRVFVVQWHMINFGEHLNTIELFWYKDE